MAPSAVLNDLGVFQDEVYTSTDLNRRSGEVLNHASKRPVTISRNNEQFALLKREDAATLVRTVKALTQVISVVLQVNSAIKGGGLAPAFKWLTVFDKDDLQALCAEVLAAAQSSDWDEVESALHAWHETSLVAQSGVLDAAMFTEPRDETPIPDPSEAPKGPEVSVIGERVCPTN